MTKDKLKAWRTLSTLTVVPRAGYDDYWGDDPDLPILEAVEDIERREAPWSRPGGPWEGAVRMNKRSECTRDDLEPHIHKLESTLTWGERADILLNGLLIWAKNTKDFRKLIKGKKFRHVFQFF